MYLSVVEGAWDLEGEVSTIQRGFTLRDMYQSVVEGAWDLEGEVSRGVYT